MNDSLISLSKLIYSLHIQFCQSISHSHITFLMCKRWLSSTIIGLSRHSLRHWRLNIHQTSPKITRLALRFCNKLFLNSLVLNSWVRHIHVHKWVFSILGLVDHCWSHQSEVLCINRSCLEHLVVKLCSWLSRLLWGILRQILLDKSFSFIHIVELILIVVWKRAILLMSVIVKVLVQFTQHLNIQIQ